MIDIIIPCYNAKETLFNTLLSVMYQTYTDFKVYLINDCSKYNYKEEVNFFSQFFDIKEIDLRKNHGPGYARNRGFEKSSSPYIVFLDSDDFFASPFALEELYKGINNSNYDIYTSKYKTKTKIEDDFFIPDYSFAVLHGKIYRRSFILKHNIKSNEKIIGGEDGSFNQLLIMCGAKLGYLDYVTYVYNWDNSNSITRSNNNEYFAQRKPENTFIMNQLWAVKEAYKRGFDVKHSLIYLVGWIIYRYSDDYSYLINDDTLKCCMKEYYRFMKKLKISDEDIEKEIDKQFNDRNSKETSFIIDNITIDYKKFVGEII